MKCLFFIVLMLISCSEASSEPKEERNPKIYFSRYSDPNRDYKNIRMIFYDKVLSWRKVLKTDSVVIDSVSLSDADWSSIMNNYDRSRLRNITSSAECGINKESFAIFDEEEVFSFFFEVNSTSEDIYHHVNGMSSNVLTLIHYLRVLEKKYHFNTHQ